MFERVKVAAVNFVPWKWHPDWNGDRLERFFTEAAKRGAKLAVAPEGILEGYLVWEALAWPKLRKQLLAIAQPLDGPWVVRFSKLAKQLKMCLVFGIAELRGNKDVYNTAVFIDQRGRLCGTYSKASNALKGNIWNFNRCGKEIRAFDTPLGRCGMLICSDRWYPEIAGALALDGAQFLCILTYGNKTKRQDRTVLTRARENGLPIIQANVGRNLIISKGEIVAIDRGRDTVTIAEIDIPAKMSAQNARALERQFHVVYQHKMAEARKRGSAKAAKYRKAHPDGGHPAKPSRPLLRLREHIRDD